MSSNSAIDDNMATAAAAATSSTNESSNAVANNPSSVRFRNRLHKAMPNISGPTAITRMRRVPDAPAAEKTIETTMVLPDASAEATAATENQLQDKQQQLQQQMTVGESSAKLLHSISTNRKPLLPTNNYDSHVSSMNENTDSNTNQYHADHYAATAVSDGGGSGAAGSATPSPAYHNHLHSPFKTQLSNFLNSSGSSSNPLSSLMPISPSIITTTSVNINQQHQHHHHYEPCTPGPLMPASVYNAKFSNEHIRNIINYKTLQKLKKLESENLKEKRKRYQRESTLYLMSKKNQIAVRLQDSNSNSSLSNDQDSNATPSMLTGGLDQQQPTIDRSKLRMRDLLYYTPRNRKQSTASNTQRDNPDEIILDEHHVDDEDGDQPAGSPLQIVNNDDLTTNNNNKNKNTTTESTTTTTTTAQSFQPLPPPPLAVQQQNYTPQLKLAEDGSLILNEESLIIQRAEEHPVFDSTVVENEQNDNLTYNSYRKFHHTKKWSQRETAKFYKALSMIGADFTMIQKLFSNRSRDEIKRKFKREEKINQALIDKILSKTSQIDLSIFIQSSEDEGAGGGGDNDSVTSSSTLNSSSNQQRPSTVVTSNSRITKNKSSEIPSEENNNSNKSAKKKRDRYHLKRVEKRAFIESETDDEDEEEKKKKKEKPPRRNSNRSDDEQHPTMNPLGIMSKRSSVNNDTDSESLRSASNHRIKRVSFAYNAAGAAADDASEATRVEMLLLNVNETASSSAAVEMNLSSSDETQSDQNDKASRAIRTTKTVSNPNVNNESENNQKFIQLDDEEDDKDEENDDEINLFFDLDNEVVCERKS